MKDASSLGEPVTGLTNFEKSMLPVYEAAIARFGDDTLYIEKKPMDGAYLWKCPGIKDTHYSLHSSVCKDRSNFWRVFDEEKAAFTAIHRSSDESKES